MHCKSEREGTARSSRRNFLAGAAAGAGALALAPRAPAQEVFVARSQFGVTRGPGTYALLERVGHGLTREECNLYQELGWSGYLERQLAPGTIDDSDLLRRMTYYQTLGWSPYTCLKTPTEPAPDWECVTSQILRAIYTKRQLQEVMVEFWLDHFNVYIYNVQRELLPTHIAFIRQHALGNFHTLLNGVVKSVALMSYLDNVSNTIWGKNQNFARELMELHTLGVDGGYTERDVETLANVFTGWGMEGWYEWPWEETTNQNWGRFRFYEDLHERTGGYFLGNTAADLIAPGGQEQGDFVLQKLALHPSTARHIARKLARKFVTEEPAASLVEGAAQRFLQTSGDLKAVLRYLLDQDRFIRNWKPKLKRPYSLVVGGLRTAKAEVTETDSIVWELLWNMRQVPLFWAPPNGYPDAASAWVDNLRPRWYFGAQFAQGWLWNARADFFSLFKERTALGVVDAINLNLFGGRLSAASRDRLLATLPERPSNDQIKEAFGLAFSMPEFQMH